MNPQLDLLNPFRQTQAGPPYSSNLKVFLIMALPTITAVILAWAWLTDEVLDWCRYDCWQVYQEGLYSCR